MLFSNISDFPQLSLSYWFLDQFQCDHWSLLFSTLKNSLRDLMTQKAIRFGKRSLFTRKSVYCGRPLDAGLCACWPGQSRSSWSSALHHSYQFSPACAAPCPLILICMLTFHALLEKQLFISFHFCNPAWPPLSSVRVLVYFNYLTKEWACYFGEINDIFVSNFLRYSLLCRNLPLPDFC